MRRLVGSWNIRAASSAKELGHEPAHLQPLAVLLALASSLVTFDVVAQKYDKPTAQDYIKRFGGQLIPAGKLELDGRRMTCGNHPTVLDSNLK